MKPWILLLATLVTFPGETAAQSGATQAKGVRYLYLVRHGIYDRDSTADDVTGNGLNALGRDQAVLAGERLAHLPVPITALVSSHYRRAAETADEIGKLLHLQARRDTMLHECTPWSSRADILKNLTKEEADAAEAQLERAWSAYVRPATGADERWVLVAHGNVIRWFVCKALGVDTKQWGQMDIGNGSITTLAVRPDGTVRLVMFSDVGHLPIAKQTWSGRGAGWAAPPVPVNR
jgi:broad specificity phosphatase PhoE